MNIGALMDPLAIVSIVLFAGIFPWMGRWEYKRLVRRSAEDIPGARTRLYNFIMAWEWITLAVLVSWWFLSGRSPATLLLVPVASGWQWPAIVVGIVLSGILIVQMITTLKKPDSLASLRGQLGGLEALVPRNSKEGRRFSLLSLTAGVCEEILYRGVLLALLTTAIGTWPAVLVSSVIFGLGHLYQGPVGFLRTAATGLVFALLTVFSGSLFTAIVLHVILDLTSGRLMSAALSIPSLQRSAHV